MQSPTNEELVKRAQAGDIEARNQLVSENLGLIHIGILQALHAQSKSMGIWMNCDDFGEYLGVGAIGMMQAINLFNPSLGYKLSTYVVPAVKTHVRRYLIRERRALRNLDARRVAAKGAADHMKFRTYLPDLSVPEEAALVEECMEYLPGRMRDVLEAKIAGCNFSEIAKRLRVTKQRAHQLYVKAIEQVACDVRIRRLLREKRRVTRERRDAGQTVQGRTNETHTET